MYYHEIIILLLLDLDAGYTPSIRNICIIKSTTHMIASYLSTNQMQTYMFAPKVGPKHSNIFYLIFSIPLGVFKFQAKTTAK